MSGTLLHSDMALALEAEGGLLVDPALDPTACSTASLSLRRSSRILSSSSRTLLRSRRTSSKTARSSGVRLTRSYSVGKASSGWASDGSELDVVGGLGGGY